MNILFIHQGHRSFFDRDIALLRDFSEVETFDNYPPSFFKTVSLISKLLKCDLVYIWFMGRHALMPLLLGKLFGKKVVLVAGGWDVADCPEIQYGLMRKGMLRPFYRYLFKLPDAIISVSKSNHSELLSNVKVNPKKSRIIYHCFQDINPAYISKQPMVLTVGEINQNNLKRKGLEFFVRAAKEFPNIPFVLVGSHGHDGAIEYLKKIAPSNVSFPGYLQSTELEKYFNKAGVYAQFSYHEAFSCSLAEAMLFECVPVVTSRYALPEVIGGAGYTVSFDNLKEAAEAVQKALQDTATGAHARKRVLENFYYERRVREIKELIDSL